MNTVDKMCPSMDEISGMYALLKDKKVILCSFREWAEAMAEPVKLHRRVAESDAAGGRYVSTVFLGMNHDYYAPGDRSSGIWFETLVFCKADDPWGGYMRRYRTYEEAEAGHKDIVSMIEMGILPQE